MVSGHSQQHEGNLTMDCDFDVLDSLHGVTFAVNLIQFRRSVVFLRSIEKR